MSNYYDFNSDNNNNELSHYPVFSEGSASSPDPDKKPSKHSKSKKKSLAKRIGSLTLSAVLFGSVAAGSFQAVNHIYTANSSSASAKTASGSSDSKASLLKTTAVSQGSGSNTGSMDVSSIAAAAMPSIVSITNKSVQEVQNYFSQFGYGGYPQTQETEARVPVSS